MFNRVAATLMTFYNQSVIRHRFHSGFFIICFVLSYNFVFSYANAETGLGINKYLFDVAFAPGESYTDSLKVMNTNGADALPLHISLSPWDTKGDSDDIEFVQNEPELNAARWFRFKESGQNNFDYILKPSEEHAINFDITVPKTAAPGSYLAMMRFQAVPTANEGLRQVPEIGVLFFIKVAALNVDAKTAYSAEIISMELILKNDKRKTVSEVLLPKANAGLVDSALKKMAVKIKNSGLYHFRLGGNVEIKNAFGRRVAYVPLPLRYFIPGKARSVDVDLAPTPADALPLTFWNRIIANARGFFYDNSYLGRYTATIALQNTSESRTIEENATFKEGDLGEYSVAFWIIPWKLWGVVLVVFLAFFLTFFWTRERILPALRALFRGSEAV